MSSSKFGGRIDSGLGLGHGPIFSLVLACLLVLLLRFAELKRGCK